MLPFILVDYGTCLALVNLIHVNCWFNTLLLHVRQLTTSTRRSTTSSTALLTLLSVIVHLVHRIGKSTGHNNFKMLLISATGATVDGVVPLVLTKSIGGININKPTPPFVKL
ncbi:hypothetical protein G6F18_014189 [Rhizopus arrhizus]|nr:hypothetical protein G6F18_014189 [Rhizopus arrhizus]